MSQDNQFGNDKDVLAAKLLDAEIHSVQVSIDPNEAEVMGAFIEDALDESDALESAVEDE